ncbi:MAG: helix-turn-helix transcriptional regulator [Bacteroidia bacterium]|nr:helix-turn-helix transcriptional regulator [Bacteroidia bacterium]
MIEDNLSILNKMPKPILTKLENRVSTAIGPNRNVARELADLLNLSQESIYRRFRGETSFSLNELLVMQRQYKISIDEIFGEKGKAGVHFASFYEDPFCIEVYLSDIYQRMLEFSGEESCKLYGLASDVPLFRFFGYPAITQFKLFYWNNLMDNRTNQKEEKFTFSPETRYPISKSIYNLYAQMQVNEVWCRDTLNGTLNQIEYFYDSGLMSGTKALTALYRDLVQLVRDLVYQENTDTTFYLYELALNNNSFYVQAEGLDFLAVGVNSINSFQTTDTSIINDYTRWLHNILSRSLKISGQPEKQKYRLFNSLKMRIVLSADKRLNQDELNTLVQ